MKQHQKLCSKKIMVIVRIKRRNTVIEVKPVKIGLFSRENSLVKGRLYST